VFQIPRGEYTSLKEVPHAPIPDGDPRGANSPSSYPLTENLFKPKTRQD